MIAVLYMTNPMWQFIIGPFTLIGIGYWLRGALDRWDSRSPVTPGPYDWNNEEDHG
ncbi:MAG: hypothetical protein HOE75_01530 [Chloroflexi bacterium]|jgi:hypothetical protein|nr:hypothetical protein [Chloroflexota bacterium]